MTTSSEPHEAPQPSVEQTSSELVKRIRKLQWMGMDEEARKLGHALADDKRADVVLSGPHDTD